MRPLRRAALVGAYVALVLGGILLIVGPTVIVARWLGRDSPWMWTVAVLATFAFDALVTSDVVQRLIRRSPSVADGHGGRPDVGDAGSIVDPEHVEASVGAGGEPTRVSAFDHE